jgi:hypothetical protein
VGRRGARSLVAAAVAVATLACAHRGSIATTPASEARTLERLPRWRTWGVEGPIHPSAATFRWTPGAVPLELHAAHWLHPGLRRLEVVGSTERASDRFLVDTGSSSSSLSAGSPLFAELAFATDAKTASRTSAGGEPWAEDGALPRLRIGDVEGRDLCFAVRGKADTRASPSNLLGGDVLQSVAIERTDAGWRLLTGSREAWRNARTASLLRPGVPIVALANARGETVHALIDTGAPMTVAFESAGPGPWTLRDEAGEVFRAERGNGAGARPSMLRVERTPVDLLLGIDALDQGTWRLDLERGTWEHASR